MLFSTQPNIHHPVEREGRVSQTYTVLLREEEEEGEDLGEEEGEDLGEEESRGLESVKCLSCSVQMRSAGRICLPTSRGSSSTANSSRSPVL